MFDSTPQTAKLSDEHDQPTDKTPRHRNSGMQEWDYREILPSPQHKASWDLRGVPRMQLRSYLGTLNKDGRVGDFIVRNRQDGASYALTTKSNRSQGSDDLLTYRIDVTESCRCRIHGCQADEIFETVEALVDFYTAGERASIGTQLSVPEGLWPFEFEDDAREQAIAGATTGGYCWPQQIPPDKRRKSDLAKVTELADLDGGDGEVNWCEARLSVSSVV